jgi:uncharacterized membrane protein
MNKFIEKIPRSFAKVLSWRIIIIGQYFCIGYYTTGSIAFGAGLAGLTTVVNSCLYFFHERAWNRAGWGKDAITPIEQ